MDGNSLNFTRLACVTNAMDAILSKPARKEIFDTIGKFRNRMGILSYKKKNITISLGKLWLYM